MNLNIFASFFVLLSISFIHEVASHSISPFDFIKTLERAQKGDNIQGLKHLKHYLNRFGYLNEDYIVNHDMRNIDYFDDSTESAVKTYQLNYNLRVTGILDIETVSMMMKPRCGVPDNLNITGRMNSGKLMHTDFVFFQGNPRWPPSKRDLTYQFLPGTPVEMSREMGRSFFQWELVTDFTFTQIEDYDEADIKIGFYRGDHGDGSPFDGPGGILAHSTAPTRGQLHFDADESWMVGRVSGGFDIGTVGLHELGHILGLQHSSMEAAIMWPHIEPNIAKGLDKDDIDGIKALYQ